MTAINARFCFVLLTLVAGLLLASCGNDIDYTATEAAPRWDTAMDIAEVSVRLPEGEGLELVEMNCVPCHSLRYIEMQPRMDRKAWEKIVSKMIKNF